jgi:hypothetical protein
MTIPISGQKVIPTAGTAVTLGNQAIHCSLMIKALDTNTGVIALGNDGANDVTLANGLRLEAGDVAVFEYVGSLASLWLDASVSGEGVSWLLLNI